MKLEPGYYRVQRADYLQPYGKKHPRSNSNTMRILKVVGVGDSARCYVDHDLDGRSIKELEDYDIDSRFEGEPKISKCRIILKFRCSKGHTYEWEMADMWGLRNVFNAITWLRKPFGFIPRVKKK